jgi:alkylation response protein AidB-like acyl-CoA dehydrogenase
MALPPSTWVEMRAFYRILGWLELSAAVGYTTSGTGSHDFTLEQVFVPEAYTWRFGPGMPRGLHYQGPLYQFPFVGLFRLPVSAVALGIAQGALEAGLALAPFASS